MGNAERPLGLVLRLLLAVVGLAAVFAVGVIGLGFARSTTPPVQSPASLIVGAFCLLIVLGGILVVRGAIRGRIRFRRIRRSRS